MKNKKGFDFNSKVRQDFEHGRLLLQQMTLEFFFFFLSNMTSIFFFQTDILGFKKEVKKFCSYGAFLLLRSNDNDFPSVQSTMADSYLFFLDMRFQMTSFRG